MSKLNDSNYAELPDFDGKCRIGHCQFKAINPEKYVTQTHLCPWHQRMWMMFVEGESFGRELGPWPRTEKKRNAERQLSEEAFEIAEFKSLAIKDSWLPNDLHDGQRDPVEGEGEASAGNERGRLTGRKKTPRG